MNLKHTVQKKVLDLSLKSFLSVLVQYKNIPMESRTTRYLDVFNTGLIINLKNSSDKFLDALIYGVKKALELNKHA